MLTVLITCALSQVPTGAPVEAVQTAVDAGTGLPPPIPGGSCVLPDGLCVEGAWLEEDEPTGSALSLGQGCKRRHGNLVARPCSRAEVFGACVVFADDANWNIQYFTIGNRLAPLPALAESVCTIGWSDRRYVRIDALENKAVAAAKMLRGQPKWHWRYPDAFLCIEPLARNKRDALVTKVFDDPAAVLRPGACPKTMDGQQHSKDPGVRFGTCLEVGLVAHHYLSVGQPTPDAGADCSGLWSAE